MELYNETQFSSSENGLMVLPTEQPPSQPFIVANTIESSVDDIRTNHIIPVFTKDNETLISQTDFINVVRDAICKVYPNDTVLKPQIRLSHPIKGRIPEAKDKAVSELLEREKTIYFERMMFLHEINSIQDTIDGNVISLCVGGVKAFNQDNLYSRSLSDQHFKVFIGFQNKVCSNLCVWSDGYVADLKVRSIGELKSAVRILIENYNASYHLFHLRRLTDFSITEQQFANLVGRCKMYHYLPSALKSNISPILFGDQQISAVVKDYYNEHSLCKDGYGNMNLWQLYNLFTNANKSSYIDSFLDRSVNASQFIEQVRDSVENKSDSWYLN